MAELPLTRTQLRNRIYRLLEDKPAVTRLTATYASSGAVTVTVADGTLFAANSVFENRTTGEHMLVYSVSTNDLTIRAEGRGYGGTTAAAGAIGELIVRDPQWSWDNIHEALNVVINDWCSAAFPRLVWDSSTGGTFSATSFVVPCPTDSYSVERVAYVPDGYTDLQDVEFDSLQTYPSAVSSTTWGVRVHFGGDALRRPWFRHTGSPIGKTVHLLVGKRWSQLEAESDSLPADFPADGVDLVVTGAALYLAGWRTVPRLSAVEVASAREMNTGQPSVNSLQSLSLQAAQWADRAQRVAARRPVGRKPGKVWVR